MVRGTTPSRRRCGSIKFCIAIKSGDGERVFTLVVPHNLILAMESFVADLTFPPSVGVSMLIADVTISAG